MTRVPMLVAIPYVSIVMVVFGRFMFQSLVVVVVNLQLKDYVNFHTVVLVISTYIGSIVKGKLMDW